jgi:hypothetical protein
MKFQLGLTIAAALASATPLTTPKSSLVARAATLKDGWVQVTTPPAGSTAECIVPSECDYSHLTMNDVLNGVCKPVAFIFARATSELGNMVRFSPGYCTVLRIEDWHKY